MPSQRCEPRPQGPLPACVGVPTKHACVSPGMHAQPSSTRPSRSLSRPSSHTSRVGTYTVDPSTVTAPSTRSAPSTDGASIALASGVTAASPPTGGRSRVVLVLTSAPPPSSKSSSTTLVSALHALTQTAPNNTPTRPSERIDMVLDALTTRTASYSAQTLRLPMNACVHGGARVTTAERRGLEATGVTRPPRSP